MIPAKKKHEDLSPAEQLLAISKNQLPHVDVTFPRKDHNGNDIKMRIELQRTEVIDECQKLAMVHLTGDKRVTDEMLQHQPMLELLADMKARSVLSRSVKLNQNRGSDGEPSYPFFFNGAAGMAKFCTEDEVLWLWKQYLVLQASAGVWHLEDLAQEDVIDSWVRRIGESGHVPLVSMPLEDLVLLVSSLGTRLYTLSQALESQSENSASILDALLPTYMVDTLPPGESAESSASSTGLPSDDVGPPGEGEKSINMDDAMKIAKDREL